MGMAKSKFFSKFQTLGKIFFFKFSKLKTLVTTQDNNFQLNYLTVQNLKIPDANFISQLWRKNQESSDLFPFGGFGKLKKLKPLDKSARNICKVILND